MVLLNKLQLIDTEEKEKSLLQVPFRVNLPTKEELINCI